MDLLIPISRLVLILLAMLTTWWAASDYQNAQPRKAGSWLLTAGVIALIAVAF